MNTPLTIETFTRALTQGLRAFTAALAAGSADDPDSLLSQPLEMPMRRLIGQHVLMVVSQGHVFSGKLVAAGETYVLLDAKRLKAWDSKHGLGAIALCGPIGATLEECGEVWVPAHSLIHVIPCKVPI